MNETGEHGHMIEWSDTEIMCLDSNFKFWILEQIDHFVKKYGVELLKHRRNSSSKSVVHQQNWIMKQNTQWLDVFRRFNQESWGAFTGNRFPEGIQMTIPNVQRVIVLKA